MIAARGRMLLAIAMMSGIPACAPSNDVRAIPVLRDSAGIAVVEHPGTAPEAARRWVVADTPMVDIGSAQADDPAYQLYRVRSVARLHDGELVVLNGGTQEVFVYDPAGRHLRTFGGRGQGPGEFTGASWLQVTPADSILVYDGNQRRFTLFDSSGVAARTVRLDRLDPWSRRPLGLLADGSIVVSHFVPSANSPPSGVQRDSVRLERISARGDSLPALGTFPGSENFWLVTSEELGAGEPLMFGTTLEIAVTDSVVYVGISDRYEIRAFDATGALRRIIRIDRTPWPVTPEMVESSRRRSLALYGDPATTARFRRVEEAMPIPPVTPFFDRMKIDTEGDLWVRTYPVHPDSNADWHVFDRAGILRATVRLPADFEEWVLESDRITGLRRDDLDVEHVVALPLRRGR